MTSIRRSLTSGIFYIAIAKYSNIFFSIIIGAILARLLTPKEFGLVALVTVFVSFFNLLGDFGLGKAVVQNQKLSKFDIQSIFSFSIVFAIVLSTLFFLSAPFMAKFYEEAELIRISKFLSLAVLFHTLQAIPKALLEKELKFKLIGLITVITQLFTGIVAIILAYKDFSYYSLVIRSILNGAILLIVFHLLSPIKVVFRIDLSSINKILRFSIFNFGFNFINYFSRNGDNLLIGKVLGATSLGFYDKAYQLMLLPINNLTGAITPAMMPVFSKYQDDKEMIFNTYLRVIKILATIGFPLSVFLFFSAHEIINIIYGAQWDQSIPVFKIVATSIGIQIIYSSASSIFQSVNRTDLLFYYGLIGAIVLLSGISYGVFVGKSIEHVGYGLFVAFSLNFFIVFYMLINMALKKSYLLFLKSIKFPLLISLIMMIPLYFFSQHETDSIFLNFGLKIIIASLTFILVFISNTQNRIMINVGISQFIQQKTTNYRKTAKK